MVRHPREYPWSSYRSNAEGKINGLLTSHPEYLRLGKSAINRRKAYRALFKAHLDEVVVQQIREATNGNYVLGNSRFQDEVARMLGRRVVRGKAGRPKMVSTDPDQMELLDFLWRCPEKVTLGRLLLSKGKQNMVFICVNYSMVRSACFVFWVIEWIRRDSCGRTFLHPNRRFEDC